MTTASAGQSFAGPYKESLEQVASLIDWLWAEHDKSFVKAGDDKVYAFGGNGFILVFDESRWEGLIELITPNGTVTMKGGNGGPEVVATVQDDAAIRDLFNGGIEGIRNYYENRYWSTPKTA